MCETGRSREHHRRRTVGKGEGTRDRNPEPAQEGFEVEISTLPPGEGEDARFLAARPSLRKAQRRHPQWPGADAYEQQLARQLATLPGGLSVTSVP